MIIPRRLYRKLADYTKPLFQVRTDLDGTITDDEIREITVRRGKSGPGGGTDPAIATVKFSKLLRLQTGADLSIRINPTVANELATMIGQTGERLRDRFTGRVGPTTVDDLGPGRQETSMDATSWIAVASTSPYKQDLYAGNSLPNIINKVLRPPYYIRNKITTEAPGDWDILHTGFADADYADVMGKLTSDIGVLVRPMRDGRNQIVNMPWRRDRALDNLQGSIAIGRRHVNAPSTWEQPNELPGDEYHATFYDGSGELTQVHTTPGGIPTGEALVRDLDWTYMEFSTDQYKHVYALRAQTVGGHFNIPSIEIDLLRLITSEHPWDRVVAGYLLILESGDHVYLGGDWPGTFSGIYFAEGIDETITPDSWVMKINLVPFIQVTGDKGPETPASYWDQATGIWDEQTARWDQY